MDVDLKYQEPKQSFSASAQILDKTVEFRQFDESFGRALARVLFSKACEVKGE